MAYSEAQRRATYKYLKNHYDSVTLHFRKEWDVIAPARSHILRTEESLVEFIARAMNETMKRDLERMGEKLPPEQNETPKQ